MYESEYKDAYDEIAVICEGDTGLRIEDISPNLCPPEEAKELIKVLNKAPKKARTLKNKLAQEYANKHFDNMCVLCQQALQNNETFDENYLYRSLEQASVSRVKKLVNAQKNGEYTLSEDLINDAFLGISDSERLTYFISAKRHGVPLINKKTLIKAFSQTTDCKNGEFERFLNVMGKVYGKCAFTRAEFEHSGENQVAFYNNILTMHYEYLPTLLQLKAQDDRPLISAKTFVQNWAGYCAKNHLQNSQKTIDILKDKNGNLMFLRKIFDTSKGENLFLKAIEEENKGWLSNPGALHRAINTLCFGGKPDYKAILSVFMSLKDQNGEWIISQENIDAFPKESPLAEVVKSYKRSDVSKSASTTGVRSRLKTGSEDGRFNRPNSNEI